MILNEIFLNTNNSLVRMKILATAKQRGSAQALEPVIRELIKRSHVIKVYATGNEAEAAGFGTVINYEIISPQEKDYPLLVKGCDLVLLGLSGYETPDGYFLRAANKKGTPTIAVQDQDAGYMERLGKDPQELPSVISVMNKECLETMKSELPCEMAEEAIKRTRVVGWTAFDDYARIRNEFTGVHRENLLQSILINPRNEIYTHFTQNIPPESAYMKPLTWPYLRKEEYYDYETKVTQKVFEAASDLKLKLIVRPHPGEEGEFTSELSKKHDFIFIPARACESKKLILASYSVTAGRSTALAEACLLDRNAGGILPDVKPEAIRPFPAISLGAIPYTLTFSGIKGILQQITSKDENINNILAEDRKKFSVDGKASARLADLVETYCI